MQDEKGHKSIRRSVHVKLIEPKAKVVAQLPSAETLKQLQKCKTADKTQGHSRLTVSRRERRGSVRSECCGHTGTSSVCIERGGDEHSTPSRVTSSRGTEVRVSDTGGDEHLTPSGTRGSKDGTAVPMMDGADIVRANGSESDEHSTPSTDRRSERGRRSTDNGSVIKQTVTKDKETASSQINTLKLGWFGTQVTHLVETIVCMGNKAGTGGKANITGKYKTNPQSQSEFSFFL